MVEARLLPLIKLQQVIDVYTQNVGWGAGTWGGVILGTATNAA
jgi:hypothetical protein